MAAIGITSAAQLASAEGSGVLGDIKIVYTFDAADGDYDVSLEFKSSNDNWVTAWDCTGTIGTDIASATSPITCYWQNTDQRGDVETPVAIKLVATK